MSTATFAPGDAGGMDPELSNDDLRHALTATLNAKNGKGYQRYWVRDIYAKSQSCIFYDQKKGRLYQQSYSLVPAGDGRTNVAMIDKAKSVQEKKAFLPVQTAPFAFDAPPTGALRFHDEGWLLR